MTPRQNLALPLALLAVVGIAGATFATLHGRRAAASIGRQSDGSVTLANQWKLTPVGTHVTLPGDMPATILVTPDGKYAVVNTCGYHNHSVSVVEIATQRIKSTIDVGQDWIGMTMGPDGTLYVSGASGAAFRKKPKRVDNQPELKPSAILKFSVIDGELVQMPGISIEGLIPKETFTAGLAMDKEGHLLVANIQNDTVYKVDASSGSVLASAKVGYRPYQLAISPDGQTVAVSNWGSSSVSLLGADGLKPNAEVAVEAHPSAVLYTSDGRLFVANAGANSVSVITSGKVSETIRTSLDAKDPIGATPLALASSKDGSRLYVANADNNDIAVVNTSVAGSSRVLGFIPTGRYPSAVAVAGDGRQLLVGTAKGLEASASATATNDPTPPMGTEVKYNYINTLLTGTLTTITLPSADELRKDTALVRANRPTGTTPELTASAQKDALKALHQIHHVIYIIKENRTYDQVLGDVAGANGAPNLVMFGQDVTPNIHQLVKTFQVFDNLYCDGETSQVGHQWTDSAYCTDYEQKQMLMSYSGRREVESDTRLSASPAGYLWQNAQKHGKTTRIFGEYLQWQEDHTSAKGAVKADPEKFGCSADFEKIFARGGRDTEKVDEFLGEMHAAEKSGVWPNLMVMALNEDHTRGLSAGAHTPWAMVGSNDLAVGKLVEGLSHSRFWKDTAVFVIEDDAQDGPDHVDAHRTEGFVVSPYLKRGKVNSTMYTTSSMIHTMELILGIPMMTQYDRAARPMLDAFTSAADFTPFTAVAPGIDLEARNPENTELARRSSKLDFSDLDKADPTEFNAILWAALKPGIPEPAPVHGLR